MSWLQSVLGRYSVSEDPLRTLRRIELVALLLGLLLCLQLAYSGARLAAMGSPDPVDPAADSLQVPPVNGPLVAAAGERNEIISRPLFWSSRRPLTEVADVEDVNNEPGNVKGIKLVGVFGSGERAGIIALVKDKKLRILVGESIEGWTLRSIDSGQVLLNNGSQSETLELQRGKVTRASEKARPATTRAAGPARKYAPPADAAPKPTDGSAGKTATGVEQAPEPAPKTKPSRALGLGPRQ